MLKCPFTDLGLVTTPQLHYITQNHEHSANVDSYIDSFARAFIDFQALIKSDGRQRNNYDSRIAVDCANGVGSIHLARIAEQLKGHLEITAFNTDIAEKVLLNSYCGAEFVQKDNKLPANIDKLEDMNKFASFDGDADRLIYFMRTGTDGLKVIDGDKQFALLSVYIQELIAILGLPDDLQVLVNTAYANGMAVKYLEANCIKNIRVPTGVKNAHPVTLQYVIGANDEPNGHGTIQVKWDQLNDALSGKEHEPAAKKLVGLLRMSNLAVGDAICNLLMIESVLCDKDFSI